MTNEDAIVKKLEDSVDALLAERAALEFRVAQLRGALACVLTQLERWTPAVFLFGTGGRCIHCYELFHDIGGGQHTPECPLGQSWKAQETARTALREPESDLASQVRALVEALIAARAFIEIELEKRCQRQADAAVARVIRDHPVAVNVRKALASDAARLFGPKEGV